MRNLSLSSTQMRTILLVILCFLAVSISAQDIYKTPSGTRYHIESCRMVNNVSQKVTLKDAAEYYGLTPCKICHPPSATSYGYQTIKATSANKAQGTDEGNLCKGITKAGTSCKHHTRIGNDYCYQHNPEVVRNTTNSYKSSYGTSTRTTSNQTTSYACGARTKSGSSCKRKVKGGGRCYQH